MARMPVHSTGCISKEGRLMGINVNMDYSTLFSSINGGQSVNYVSNLAGMVSDMNAIQNGSYGKLVGAYYSKLEKEGRLDNNKSDDEGKVSERLSNSRTYNSIASGANSLEGTAEKLYSQGTDSVFQKKLTTTGEGDEKSSGYAYDEDKIVSSVKNLVNGYNSLVKAGANATDSRTATGFNTLNRISDSYSGKLSDIGISYDDETGALSLDTDKMKKAGMDKVKSVIGGRNGFAYQVSSAASQIESAAKSAANSKSLYNANGSTSSSSINYGSLMNSIV